MSDFAQMHIFFFVTTVVVVILAALVAVAIFYVVRILRTVDRLSSEVLEEGQLLRQDIADLRMNVKAEGFKVKHLFGFVRKRAERMAGMKKSRTEE